MIRAPLLLACPLMRQRTIKLFPTIFRHCLSSVFFRRFLIFNGLEFFPNIIKNLPPIHVVSAREQLRLVLTCRCLCISFTFRYSIAQMLNRFFMSLLS